MSAKTDTFFETMTDKTIKALESALDSGWDKPWENIFGGSPWPENAKTGNRYQGGNAFWFWFVGTVEGYTSNLWATYRQWDALGAQVQKGQKGTQGIKWVVSYRCTQHDKYFSTPCSTPGHTSKKSLYESIFTVFNIEQTDAEVETIETPVSVVDTHDAIEAFLGATGANIKHNGGDQAYYTPGTNNISLPPVEAFTSTHGYYATVLHELTHWTGDESRQGRDQKNVFGSERYAAEELVAEFGSIFLQAHFGLSPEPSVNSISYVKGWLKALKADPKNLWKAAQAAQKATKWVLDLTSPEEVETV